jgi:signal transduction histidine kinase
VTERQRAGLVAGAVVVAGLAGAGVAAALLGVTVHDAVLLVAIASGGAFVAGAVGWVVVRTLRTRSLRLQVMVVAVVAVVASGIGVLAAAEAMFISSHDLGVLLVVLLASAAGGAGAALACAVTVSEASVVLGDLARRLVPEGDETAPPHSRPNVADPSIAATPPPAGDLARLGRELEDVRRRLEDSHQRAEALDGSRRELVAWVSHDLRAPLAAVRAMAEALEDGLLPDQDTTDRYHAAIRVETERLTKLVDELFELSRVTSGTQRPDPDRAELGELVDFAAAAGASIGEARQVRVTSDVPSDGASSRGVPARDVARILTNLVDNAVRHSRPGSVVKVTVTSAGEDSVLVHVDDECGGIPEADLARVFDTAFRGDSARNSGHGGGGLGLPIAQGLAGLIGGDLTATNHSNGCRFTVWIPALDAPAVETPPSRRSAPPVPVSPVEVDAPIDA